MMSLRNGAAKSPQSNAHFVLESMAMVKDVDISQECAKDCHQRMRVVAPFSFTRARASQISHLCA